MFVLCRAVERPARLGTSAGGRQVHSHSRLKVRLRLACLAKVSEHLAKATTSAHRSCRWHYYKRSLEHDHNTLDVSSKIPDLGCPN